MAQEPNKGSDTLNTLLSSLMNALGEHQFDTAINKLIELGNRLRTQHGVRERSLILGRKVMKEAGNSSDLVKTKRDGYVTRRVSPQLFKSEFIAELERAGINNFQRVGEKVNQDQARALWALIAAWEDAHIGRGVKRREGDTREFFKNMKNKADWSRRDRHDMRLGLEFAKAFIIPTKAELAADHQEELRRFDLNNRGELRQAYELDQKASAAIQGYRNGFQKLFKWIGIVFALAFAIGCGFQTFAAMFSFLDITTSIVLGVILSISIVQFSATTAANWLICRTHVPNLIRWFSEWRVHKFRSDKGGEFQQYSSGGFKLFVAFLLSLPVGMLFGALTWQALFTIPAQVSFLAGFGFITSPMAIILGLAITVSMTLLIMGEMVEFFQLDWTRLPSELYGQFKDHFKGLANRSDFPHLTQAQADSQARWAKIGTAFVTVMIAIGLAATMYACMVALMQVLPMIGPLANLSSSTIFDFSLTLSIVSFFGQMAFVFKTGGKMVANVTALIFRIRYGSANDAPRMKEEGEKVPEPVEGLFDEIDRENSNPGKEGVLWAAKIVNAFGNALIPFAATVAMVGIVFGAFPPLVNSVALVVTFASFIMSFSAPAAGESLNAKELPRTSAIGRIMAQLGFRLVKNYGYQSDKEAIARLEVNRNDKTEFRILEEGEAPLNPDSLVATTGAVRVAMDLCSSPENRISEVFYGPLNEESTCNPSSSEGYARLDEEPYDQDMRNSNHNYAHEATLAAVANRVQLQAAAGEEEVVAAVEGGRNSQSPRG